MALGILVGIRYKTLFGIASLDLPIAKALAPSCSSLLTLFSLRVLGKYRVVDGPADMERKRQLAVF